MSDETTTAPAAANGAAAEEQPSTTRARPYVVLEQANVIDLIQSVFKEADLGLAADEWEKLRVAVDNEPAVFMLIANVNARNSLHALLQVGRTRRAEGWTPPLAAVSERMFQPKRVEVSFDPKVTVS